MESDGSYLNNGLARVIQRLFSYLKYQRRALAKQHIISEDMDETFQELMMEMNEYLFSEFKKQRTAPSPKKLLQNSPKNNQSGTEQNAIKLLEIQTQSDSKEFFDDDEMTESLYGEVNASVDSESLISEEANDDNNVYGCLVCSEDFKSISKLHSHTREYHKEFMKEGDFECGVCGFLFTDVQNLKKHEIDHIANEKEQKLKIAKKTTKKNKRKSKAIATISKTRKKQKPSASQERNQALLKGLSTDELNEYIDNLQPDQCCNGSDGERPFLCKFCSKGFPSFPGLIQHLTNHLNTKVYKCTYCSLRFKSPTSLGNHVKSFHLKIRSFECTTCNKKFTLQGTLKEHMITHTGEKPYPCNICGRSFASRSIRSRHKRKTHNGKSDYACSICLIEFDDESMFQQHVMKHASADEHPNTKEEEEEQQPSAADADNPPIEEILQTNTEVINITMEE